MARSKTKLSAPRAAAKARSEQAAPSGGGKNRVMASSFKANASAFDDPADDLLAVQLDFREENLDWDIMESGFAAVANDQFEKMSGSRRDRRLERRFNRDRFARLNSTQRAYRRYLAEGGEPGRIQQFLEWIIANWETIFAIIKQIIGLFGGGVPV